jgi:hypothetical protein
MIVLINVGRLAMVVWVIYSLLLVFAPAYIHRQPNPVSGISQFVLAYGVGYALDRVLGVLRRRKAAREAPEPAASDVGRI